MHSAAGLTRISTPANLHSAAYAQPALPDEGFECEPPTRDILVVESDPEGYGRIERCLTYMTRIEPRITLAGTIAAANFAAKCCEFHLILAVDTFDPASTAALFSETSPRTRCVLITKTARAQKSAAAVWNSAVACLAQSDLTPRRVGALLPRQTLAGVGSTRPAVML